MQRRDTTVCQSSQVMVGCFTALHISDMKRRVEFIAEYRIGQPMNLISTDFSRLIELI